MVRSKLSVRPMRTATFLFALVCVSAVFASTAAAHRSHHGHHWPPATHKSGVTVMTRNMYFGADLTRSIAATTIPDLLAANAQIYTNVIHSDIPARARLIAREIARTRPDLVGLQEVSQWLSGPLGDPADATTLEYDQLASLQYWLAAYGAPYKVVKSQQQISIESPAGAPYNKDFRLIDRDVILAPLWGSPGVSLSNPAGANFVNNFSVTTGVGATIEVKRGWVSVDVNARGRKFRFVNTHLESFHPGFRAQQAGELVAPTGAVGSAPGKVVLVGDMNSDPNEPSPGNLAFGALLAGGLTDTWPVANPGDPGYTFGFGELVDDPSPAGLFNQRIDHVMTKGAITVRRSRLIGLDPDNRTASGLWPSDHAGLVAKLRP
ncbi:MAG: endonuclease/exonuclease/phosphatase family protein [Thermoleophilaceae bacterium]|nr:endonuclease/exonuclease/phosphatase family protein [Thermoleophilaceae bacterium]